MLIAIEGPDLTGKSTLAAELSAAWDDAPIIHAGVPQTTAIAAYEDPILNYDPLSGTKLILDRWHVGEYVWPAVFRRPTDYVDSAVVRHVEMFMCSRGCTVVYTSRNYNSLHAALTNSDEPLRPSHLARTLELFEDALDVGHNRGYVFDHDHEDRHLTATDLEFLAGQAWDDIAGLHGISPAWIGNPQPRYMIAVHGHSDHTSIPGRDGSGLDATVAQLLRSLPNRGWKSFAVVDTARMTNLEFTAWSDLAKPRGWITVGEQAHQKVRELDGERYLMNVPYGTVTLGDLTGAIERWIKDDKW